MVKPITYWELCSQIKSRKVNPLYLFTGNQIYLKREIESALREAIIPAETIQFNYNIFFAEDADFNQILNVAGTLPFMNNWRLVILKNVEKFSMVGEKIFSFLQQPHPNSCFVLETEIDKPNQFIDQLSDLALVVNFAPLKGVVLKRWLSEYMLKKGKKISALAMELILENVGEDLDILANTLDKLCVFKQNASLIQEKDVEAVVDKTRLSSRFAFLDALVSKQVNKALIIANELARVGATPADVIGLINWQLKRIEYIKQKSRNGVDHDIIAKELKVLPFRINRVFNQAEKFSTKGLRRNFRLLLDLDVAIKQGRTNPWLGLETLIINLCAEK